MCRDVPYRNWNWNSAQVLGFQVAKGRVVIEVVVGPSPVIEMGTLSAMVVLIIGLVRLSGR